MGLTFEKENFQPITLHDFLGKAGLSTPVRILAPQERYFGTTVAFLSQDQYKPYHNAKVDSWHIENGIIVIVAKA